ncbi:hypothetical protein ABPG74_005145 [Tetrahymena malaccensis]
MEQNNIQKQSDQEYQETMHKQNNQNNSSDSQQNANQQNNNLQFEQTPCSYHKDQKLVFLNKTSNTKQKLVCYQCCFEQRIQQENVFELKQFFTMSEKQYLENFLKFEQYETSQIFEKIYDKNYIQLFSKIHIDALLDQKNKIVKYIDDQIKQINEAAQECQQNEKNLKQQFNYCQIQESLQHVLSQKNAEAQDLEKKISKILEDQSKNISKFESSLREYITNMNKQTNQIDQITQNFQKNIIDFISNNNNNKLNINYPKEIENVTLFQIQSKIISIEESYMIQKWIGNGFNKFKQIYAATQHGFQIENIYKQCIDKTKVIFLIKTTSNQRFGFYSDLQIKNQGGIYATQNPNNIFLFSLDLKQKYTSNESNCSYAFYSNNNQLGLGCGHDICLHTNSNNNNKSYVSSCNYGKNEGLTGNALNGGTQNFTTSEIEIFEIISI